MILWVESFDGWQHPDYNLWWPSWTAPTLMSILRSTTDHLIVLEGEIAAAVEKEVGYLPKATLLESDDIADRKYVVISRGLLPHESLAAIDAYQYGYIDPGRLDDGPLHCGQ